MTLLAKRILLSKTPSKRVSGLMKNHHSKGNRKQKDRKSYTKQNEMYMYSFPPSPTTRHILKHPLCLWCSTAFTAQDVPLIHADIDFGKRHTAWLCFILLFATINHLMKNKTKQKETDPTRGYQHANRRILECE